MKKIIAIIMLLGATTAAMAQFEKDTKYVGASLTGFNLSVSDRHDLHVGLNLKGGYFFERDWMAEAQFGFNYSNSKVADLLIGAKVRYYTRENGLFYAGGLQYVHEYRHYDDWQITPELGYCYYLNHYISVEPSIYYDISLTDIGHKSELGLKLGIGIYF
ncbi:MAG: hypothetical protein IJ557_04920 [Bacteroidaceae bacterium]|nr:hypothetical protein [Bacteroidaceae bacterium]